MIPRIGDNDGLIHQRRNRRQLLVGNCNDKLHPHALDESDAGLDALLVHLVECLIKNGKPYRLVIVNLLKRSENCNVKWRLRFSTRGLL